MRTQPVDSSFFNQVNSDLERGQVSCCNGRQWQSHPSTTDTKLTVTLIVTAITATVLIGTNLILDKMCSSHQNGCSLDEEIAKKSLLTTGLISSGISVLSLGTVGYRIVRQLER